MDESETACTPANSTSAYASPMVAILKKDGNVRVTVNDKKLNAINSLGQLPIPRVGDTVTLRRSK